MYGKYLLHSKSAAVNNRSFFLTTFNWASGPTKAKFMGHFNKRVGQYYYPGHTCTVPLIFMIIMELHVTKINFKMADQTPTGSECITLEHFCA